MQCLGVALRCCCAAAGFCLPRGAHRSEVRQRVKPRASPRPRAARASASRRTLTASARNSGAACGRIGTMGCGASTSAPPASSTPVKGGGDEPPQRAPSANEAGAGTGPKSAGSSLSENHKVSYIESALETDKAFADKLQAAHADMDSPEAREVQNALRRSTLVNEEDVADCGPTNESPKTRRASRRGSQDNRRRAPQKESDSSSRRSSRKGSLNVRARKYLSPTKDGGEDAAPAEAASPTHELASPTHEQPTDGG